MIKLKDIRKGDTFFEEAYGTVAKYIALEDAHEVHEKGWREGWECRAQWLSGSFPKTDEDGIVTFFENFDAGAYALRLYAADEN